MNFHALALARDRGPIGALLLTQAASEEVFEWLRDQSRVGAWSVERIESEPQSLHLKRQDEEMLVVCGRQIATQQGLEVLALGTDQKFADGLGLENTLAEVRKSGALPVLPWGFGKWFGRRGRRVRDVLAGRVSEPLWVGDSGGRLRGLRRPKLLDEAESRAIRVLPGTDPFPFKRDYRRVGGFGCLVAVTYDRSRPWQSIVERLGEMRTSPQPYGRATGWFDFGVKQFWIQVHMRLPGRS